MANAHSEGDETKAQDMSLREPIRNALDRRKRRTYHVWATSALMSTGPLSTLKPAWVAIWT